MDFQYPAVAPPDFPSASETGRAEREARIQRAQAAALEAARQKGVQEGERRAQAAADQRLAAERQAILSALQDFAEERRRYFHVVEGDVVTLSLAIARKLLRREAQIDPLLLSGVVRVALDEIQAGSRVLLRCAPAQVSEWQNFLAKHPDALVETSVVADDAVPHGTVVLETSAGKAALRVEDHLKEIESGFLDLLHVDEERPDERPTIQLP